MRVDFRIVHENSPLMLSLSLLHALLDNRTLKTLIYSNSSPVPMDKNKFTYQTYACLNMYVYINGGD
jgi:hypothetical protein